MKKRFSDNPYTTHWKRQRISAIALIFLFSWFMYYLFMMSYDREHIIQNVLYSPLRLVAFVALFNISIYHGILGFRVVCEDYIHNEPLRIGAVVVSYIIGFATIIILTILLVLNFWIKS